MKCVTLVSHVGKPEVMSLAEELIEWFKKQRVQVNLPMDDASMLDHQKLACSDEELFSQANLVVTLGGDGTFLRAVRLLRGKDVPVLGVNLGKFGFLSEVEVSRLRSSLAKVIEGKFDLESRMMLDCEIYADEKKSKYHALNEVVVGKSIGSKLIRLSVDVNGGFFNRYACDGIIFATPTGSTAYSLSSGGPIVNPKIRAVLMTPVCSHTLFGRTLILAEDDTASVKCLEKKVDVDISVDGVKICQLESLDFLKVCTSSSFVNLVRIEKYNFYATLREKLKKRALYQFSKE